MAESRGTRDLGYASVAAGLWTPILCAAIARSLSVHRLIHILARRDAHDMCQWNLPDASSSLTIAVAAAQCKLGSLLRYDADPCFLPRNSGRPQDI